MSRNESIEVIARGVLQEDSKVLVCWNIKHGYCFLPGGHVEFREPAGAALRREFLEECGVEVTVGECVLVAEGAFGMGDGRHHEVNIVFHVERLAGGPRTDVVSREPKIRFEWIEPARLPGLDLRPEAVRRWLMGGNSRSLTAAWESEISSEPK